MASLKGDLGKQLAFVRGTNPVATASSAQTGATFDRGIGGAKAGDGNSAVAVVFYFGLYTDGTWTPDIEESDDDSSWTSVAAANRVGTLSAVSSTATDAVIQVCSYTGSKRYVRGVLAETVNGTTGVQYACLYVGAGAEGNTTLEAA